MKHSILYVFLHYSFYLHTGCPIIFTRSVVNDGLVILPFLNFCPPFLLPTSYSLLFCFLLSIFSSVLPFTPFCPDFPLFFSPSLLLLFLFAEKLYITNFMFLRTKKKMCNIFFSPVFLVNLQNTVIKQTVVTIIFVLMFFLLLIIIIHNTRTHTHTHTLSSRDTIEWKGPLERLT